MPATRIPFLDDEAAATPIIRLAVETMASFDPSTPARSHPTRPLRCLSGACALAIVGFIKVGEV
jgi:hypothetical protein